MNHHHATTQRPVDVSARTLNPFDEFDRTFLSGAPVVDKDAEYFQTRDTDYERFDSSGVMADALDAGEA